MEAILPSLRENIRSATLAEFHLFVHPTCKDIGRFYKLSGNSVLLGVNFKQLEKEIKIHQVLH